MFDQSPLEVSAGSTAACFSVIAACNPGVMPRVLEIFVKRGVVPSRWYSLVTGPRGDELHIDVQAQAMEAADAERIAASLRQVIGVDTVLVSEKRDRRQG
jgi:acetolactate synthase small subunit